MALEGTRAATAAPAYRAHVRVERTTFEYLVSRLDATAVDMFYSSDGWPQFPVSVQLAIALYRFSHYGNSASTIFVAQKFGVSQGTVVGDTRRVVRAILRWEEQEVRWQAPDRRQVLSVASEAQYGFGGCLGAADGTLIPLAYAPSVNPWTFYDRKGRYRASILLVCDWDLRVTSLVQGFTGAAPDTVVQAVAPWQVNPSAYFSDGEYLLGDKGIMLASTHVILPHKAPSASEPPNKIFNFQHARRRVPAERCISVIKGRLMSFRDLRIPVATAQVFTNASEWMVACTTLHNICVDLNDVSSVSEPVPPSSESWLPLGPAATSARQQVPPLVIHFLRVRGLYHA